MGCFDNMAEEYYDPDSTCRRTTWIVLGSILAVCILIVGFTLLGVSVNKKVENNQYGIVYHKTTTMSFGPVLDQGIHAIPPGSEILIFVRTLQDVDTGEIQCYSSDRLVMTLTVSVQYQLVKEEIISTILKKYNGNDNFRTILKNIVESVIISQCGQYTAEDFYVQRAQVDTDMKDSLLVAVNNKSLGATIEFFQLLNIQFPVEFSTAITEKQIAIQNATTTLNQRTSLLISANTTYLEALRIANVTMQNAENTADVTLRQANATSNVIFNQWYQRGLAYSSIKNSLNLDQTGFINYLKNEAIRLASAPIISI